MEFQQWFKSQFGSHDVESLQQIQNQIDENEDKRQTVLGVMLELHATVLYKVMGDLDAACRDLNLGNMDSLSMDQRLKNYQLDLDKIAHDLDSLKEKQNYLTEIETLKSGAMYAWNACRNGSLEAPTGTGEALCAAIDILEKHGNTPRHFSYYKEKVIDQMLALQTLPQDKK